MIPFRVTFRPGLSIFEQVVYATKRAMVSGQLRPGDAFPSVRVLSRELKINPNTAHKIVAYLVNEGLLGSRPGIGTVVAEIPDSTGRERAALLGRQIEELVVDAKRLGIPEEEVTAALRKHWEQLSGDERTGDARPAEYREGGAKGDERGDLDRETGKTFRAHRGAG